MWQPYKDIWFFILPQSRNIRTRNQGTCRVHECRVIRFQNSFFSFFFINLLKPYPDLIKGSDRLSKIPQWPNSASTFLLLRNLFSRLVDRPLKKWPRNPEGRLQEFLIIEVIADWEQNQASKYGPRSDKYIYLRQSCAFEALNSNCDKERNHANYIVVN